MATRKKKKRVVAKRETDAQRKAARKKTSSSEQRNIDSMAAQVKKAQETVNQIAGSRGLSWDAGSKSYKSSGGSKQTSNTSGYPDFKSMSIGITPATQTNTTPAKTSTSTVPQSVVDSIYASAKANNWSDASLNSALEGARQNYGASSLTAPSSAGQNTSGFADLKSLSVAATQPADTQQSPEEWAKAFMEQYQSQNPDTSGVGTQSTQGDATAGMQPGVNDAVAGAAGGAGMTGSIGGQAGVSVPGAPGSEQALMTGGTPMATIATGGYQKIGPAYFQKTSDGMRAVSDPSIISGLKHGTIPYTTGQLDGTTFSKYSVPLATTGSTTETPPGSTANEGAGLMNTYQNYQQKYGLTQTQTDYFNDPMKVVRDITTQIYEMSGVSDANDMIKDITGDLEDLENERDDKIADINDNPWLTEGVRLRQIASVEARYEDKIANHTNRLRLLEDVRNNAQQQAQFAVGTAISLWDKERTFQQHQIDSWNEQAQREIDNAYKAAQLELGMFNATRTKMDEYLDAKAAGFSGSYNDYYNYGSDGGGGLLTPAQMNATVNQITGAFDNEPIVREYNTVSAGLNFLRSLGTSPTDDQARIYQFAKIMDPNSAVREGEYATVQEYSTALLQRYGLQASRVFTNSGILTPEARSFLLTTLEKRHAVSQGQYDNLYQQYQARIQNVMSGGFNTLPQYSYTQPQAGGGNRWFTIEGQTQGGQSPAPITTGMGVKIPLTGNNTVMRVN